MTTDQKPTQGQMQDLRGEFTAIFRQMNTMIQYHNNRMNFFKKWNLSLWKNLAKEDYKKYKNILFDMNEKINSLRKEEFPMLDFLHFLSNIYDRQEGGENVPIISRVKGWQFLFANYFSMPNVEMKLFAKFNAEQRQQRQQKQQGQPKPNKDKERKTP